MYDDNPDIIPFPHFIPESRYKDLMRALNNPQVTEFFNAAKDEEDAYLRYRVFIDRNGLSFTEQYRLNQDKAITLMNGATIMIYRIYTALKIAENIYSTIMMIWRVKSGKFRIWNEQGMVPCPKTGCCSCTHGADPLYYTIET